MDTVIANIIQSLHDTTWLEWVGTVFGFLSVWFFVRVNILSWPTTLISVSAYAILFFRIHLYADALLQVFFFVISSIGWWEWHKNKKDKNQEELPITMLSQADRIKIFFVMVACILLSGFMFSRFTDAHIPFWDSTASGMSVTAQLLLIRKKFENWILWIVVNILSIGIYYYKQVYLTTILFSVYLVLSTQGFFEWKKLYKLQSKKDSATV